MAVLVPVPIKEPINKAGKPKVRYKGKKEVVRIMPDLKPEKKPWRASVSTQYHAETTSWRRTQSEVGILRARKPPPGEVGTPDREAPMYQELLRRANLGAYSARRLPKGEPHAWFTYGTSMRPFVGVRTRARTGAHGGVGARAEYGRVGGPKVFAAGGIHAGTSVGVRAGAGVRGRVPVRVKRLVLSQEEIDAQMKKYKNQKTFYTRYGISSRAGAAAHLRAGTEFNFAKFPVTVEGRWMARGVAEAMDNSVEHLYKNTDWVRILDYLQNNNYRGVMSCLPWHPRWVREVKGYDGKTRLKPIDTFSEALERKGMGDKSVKHINGYEDFIRQEFHSWFSKGSPDLYVKTSRSLWHQTGTGRFLGVSDSRTSSWIHFRASASARGIADRTRQAFRLSLQYGKTWGLRPHEQIFTYRLTLGLNPRQTSLVWNFRAGLMAKRVTQDVMHKSLAAFSSALRKDRHEMIAMTETMYTHNQAQLKLFEDLVRNGELPIDAERVWYLGANENHCAQCVGFSGMRARSGEPFPNGLLGPPAHPDCHCTQGLILPGNRQVILITEG